MYKTTLSLISKLPRKCKIFKNSLTNLASNRLVNTIELIETNDPNVLNIMKDSMIIQPDFLSIQEEKSLLEEVEPYISKLRYEYDHWDDAIHGFRETERLKWSENNQKILNRVKKYAFDYFSDANKNSNILNHIHILDLNETGYIKPHVDAVRFCGNTIAGLSLLSDCVMRLINENDKSKTASVWLKRRSLYIMRNQVRYDYAHEVLKKSESFFKGNKIEKSRRISIICRNEPTNSDTDDKLIY